MSEGDAMLDAVMATAGKMTSQHEEGEGDGEAPSTDLNQSSNEELHNDCELCIILQL